MWGAAKMPGLSPQGVSVLLLQVQGHQSSPLHCVHFPETVFLDHMNRAALMPGPPPQGV